MARPIPRSSALLLLVFALAGCTGGRELSRVPLFRPFVIAAYVAESRAHAAQFDNTGAVEAIDRALALSPDDPTLLLERGRRYLLAYRWDDARADFERAVVLNPDNAVAYYSLGLLFASAPEGIDARQQAVDAFTRAVMLAPAGVQADNARRYIVQLEAQLSALGRP